MPTLTELKRLPPAKAAQTILEAHPGDGTWLDEFSELLDRRRAGRALRRILGVWGLSQSEAARLFGVTRQAVSKWLVGGVPAERSEAVADLAAATDLLVRHLKRDRIPAVVRRRARALGGSSLIDLLAASRTHDVLEACRSMFDFEAAHA
jgi:predicted transcriptional regulator